MGLGPLVEAVQQCHQELVELLLALLLGMQEQVDLQRPQREEVEDLRPAELASTGRTAGALAVLKRQSLAMSHAPGNPLLWPVSFTGTFTGKRGVGVGSGHIATVVAGLRIRRIRETPLLRDWQVRPPVLHVPTAGPPLTVGPPAQTLSAAPAAAQVAGES